MNEQMPGTPDQPPEKKGRTIAGIGISTLIAVIAIVGMVLLLFGVCFSPALFGGG